MIKKLGTDKKVLVFNAGSATLKWALYDKDSLVEIGRGTLERIGQSGSFAEWRLLGKLTIKQLNLKDHTQAVSYVVKILTWHKLLPSISLVGHRLVHGGRLFTKPVRLNKKIIRKLNSLNILAPLHNPVELATAKQAHKLLPKAVQVATFDTAWFASLPPAKTVYAIPQTLSKKYNLKKYGFHGLSHSYVTKEACRILNKNINHINLVTCHLGSGSSVTAVRAGKPVDTSMGFTPLEGLVMCNRAGDIDPGLILFLLRQKGINLNSLDTILNHESGLKALAGVSDMREVLTRAGYEVLGFKVKRKFSLAERTQAKLALQVYIYRLQKYIGAYAAILGSVDAVVFTGGIGERNELIRNLTMLGLPGLKNIKVLAIPTNEELAIAHQII